MRRSQLYGHFLKLLYDRQNDTLLLKKYARLAPEYGSEVS
jgi:hypothetical protein